MGSDIFVALGKATVDGATHFGLNHHSPVSPKIVLKRLEGRTCVADQTVLDAKLVQPKNTYTVLGCQVDDAWGLTHGLNEHHLIVALANWQSRLSTISEGLTGTELVRLALERSKSARAAVEVLTDLISRVGQSRTGAADADSIYIVADGKEAFLVEAAGKFWATVQCEQARAVADVALIRQEWGRVSRGVAEAATQKNWRIDDGRKLDFAGSLSQTGPAERWGLRRWGRATLLLEQQHGSIDPYFLRRMLAEHFDSQIAAPAVSAIAPGRLHLSFHAVACNDPCALPRSTWAFGDADHVLYFPMFMEGELPVALAENAQAAIKKLIANTRKNGDRDALEKLQARLDQQADQFAEEGRDLKERGNLKTLRQRATQFMHSCLTEVTHVPIYPAHRRQPVAEFSYVTE